MYYFVTVCDDKMVLEKVWFETRDQALYFAERRRKQGYTVIVKASIIK